MKKIVIPKNLPGYLIEPLNNGIELAYGFVCSRYGYRFNDVVMIIQPSATRSRYFANDKEPHPIYGYTPVVTIQPRTKLYLYEKKSLGKYRQGLPVGYQIDIACSIIHELTHHVQFIEGRSMGELETTRNEIEFLQIHSPQWYNLLIKPI